MGREGNEGVETLDKPQHPSSSSSVEVEVAVLSGCAGTWVNVRLSQGCVARDDSGITDAEWAAGFRVSMKQNWSVRQLVTDAEDKFRGQFGLGVVTALVLCPSRDCAVPFYEPASDFFSPEDVVELVGDVTRVHPLSGAYSHNVDHVGADDGPSPSRPAAQKVPVTILTGFLGAGKTTMLNHILHVQRAKRIAVIENEFGEVPIDGELLADGDGLSAAEQVVVLDNGCMCCTVRGDLLGAFASVRSKMEQTTEDGTVTRALDSVLVETTGMADPVPIVRTLLQTPAIARAFSLDGVVTLVDAKNVLPRLRDGEAEMAQEGKQDGGVDTVDEAFQQIMFSDRIVVNKVDLVSAAMAIEVFQRVRSINATAGIVSCSRGKLDPAELESLRAFDGGLESEEEPAFVEGDRHGHDHSRSHSHGHDRHDHRDNGCDGGDSCTEGHHVHDHGHDHKEGRECTLEHDHSGHDHRGRHSSQVGTFSLVKKSTEVLALPFARWVRSLALLPKERGTLFRSKAVLAVAGSDRKLVFHAVSDVMERKMASRWGKGEGRSCRIVFIGKRLDRPFLEEGFNSTTRPVVSRAVSEGSATAAAESSLEGMAARVASAFSLAMAHLGTGDVLRVGSCSCALAEAINGGGAEEHYRFCAAEDGIESNRGFHLSLRRSSPKFYLHPFVSAATARSYAKAAAGANLEITPSMGQGRTGIAFKSAAEIEAAGVTWLEDQRAFSHHSVLASSLESSLLESIITGRGRRTMGDDPSTVGVEIQTHQLGDDVEQLADPSAKNFVIEFAWRAETMASFFASPNSSTSSAMVKIEYQVEDDDAFDEETDTVKFRLVLRPETDENNRASSSDPPANSGGEAAAGAAEGGALPLHRLMIQTVGGRSCSQVYGLSFHSISPLFQVHVQVPDHRVPYFQTDQLFHKWHPLMEHLKQEPRLRFLVRMKPDGSGPLDNMCGCC